MSFKAHDEHLNQSVVVSTWLLAPLGKIQQVKLPATVLPRGGHSTIRRKALLGYLPDALLTYELASLGLCNVHLLAPRSVPED